MNIQTVLRSLQIPATSSIHSVYLIGSRLWGTETPKSDFDLLVVLHDSSSSSTPFQKSQHKGNYDVTLLTESEFQRQIESGSIIETICCLLAESESSESNILHDSAPGQVSRARRALVSMQAMRTWVDDRALRDLEKAEKFWRKGGSTRENGWKILHHSIAAESIFGGLLELGGPDVQELRLTKAKIHEWVARGRESSDGEWLGLEWVDVLAAYRGRMESVKAGGS
ncbi:hypothetical protein C8F01DRAFT_1099055 [Mycena amicta]|nr:hypothetical protein C8F01DRAFT_1099055 [Mycena amicta]